VTLRPKPERSGVTFKSDHGNLVRLLDLADEHGWVPWGRFP
jgi:hypothetical protein